MTDHLSKIGTRLWAVPAGLLFGAVLAAILVAGYAWQSSESDSKLADAVVHAETAVYLQEASAEGNLAADLLGAYVLEGDESLIPRIQNHFTTAQARLTGAVSGSGSDAVRQIVILDTVIAEGAGSVIALRQAGDAEAAGEALTEVGAEFETLGIAIQSAIDAELESAVSLTNSSQNADDTASWLLITGIAVAIATGAALLFIVGRSLLKRSAPESPSPA